MASGEHAGSDMAGFSYPTRQRDYERMAGKAAPQLGDGLGLQSRLLRVIDILWTELSPTGVSWTGFYFEAPQRPEMILGPHRDRPACSPIGLHGACGRSFQLRAPQVIRDVRKLGADYIACDPRDRSEVVVPFYDGGGDPVGVLDLDSFEVDAFHDEDTAGLERVLDAAGLGRPAPFGHHAPGFGAVVADARRRIRECSLEDLRSWLENGEPLCLIDVREESEFSARHMPGAAHLGRGILERDIEARVPELSTRIVLYCGGGYRSALAADSLQRMGYSNVISLWGGFRAWHEAGLPVER